MAHNKSALAHHFEDLPQQRETVTLGMWAFLATEVLFFGGLFVAYLVYRSGQPEVFAEASQKLSVMLGAINTGVLLTSSLTMALAVHAAQEGKRKVLVRFMVATIVLGLMFMGIKAVEYSHKFQEGLFPGSGFTYDGAHAAGAQIYFSIYFMMTGVHALHMVVGVAILGIMTVFAARGKYTAEYYQPVEMFGLYWHFVDIVWIFLYPMLYLINVHG